MSLRDVEKLGTVAVLGRAYNVCADDNLCLWLYYHSVYTGEHGETEYLTVPVFGPWSPSDGHDNNPSNSPYAYALFKWWSKELREAKA